MKKVLSLFLFFVLILIYSASISFSSPPIKWQPNDTGGSFIVGEDTKSIPDIDRMYVATGATIQSDFHANVFNFEKYKSVIPKRYTLLQFTEGKQVLYSQFNNTGFSLNQ